MIIKWTLGYYLPTLGQPRWFERLKDMRDPFFDPTNPEKDLIVTAPVQSMARPFDSREEAIKFRQDYLSRKHCEIILRFGAALCFLPEGWKIYPLAD